MQRKTPPPQKEDDKITKMIESVQKRFPEIKTTLGIRELIEPAVQTRAKGIPRPQNCFMLYRKDISARAKLTGESQSVGASSKTASETWREITEREKRFWQALFDIVKEKHHIQYPSYRYQPVRVKKQRKGSDAKTTVDNNNNTTTNGHKNNININNSFIFHNEQQQESKLNFQYHSKSSYHLQLAPPSTGMSDIESSGSSNEPSSFHSAETSIHDLFDDFSRFPHDYYELNNGNYCFSTEINENNFEPSYALHEFLNSITSTHNNHETIMSAHQFIHNDNQCSLDDFGQQHQKQPQLKQEDNLQKSMIGNYHNLSEESLSNYLFEEEEKERSRLSLPLQPFPEHYFDHSAYPAQISYFIQPGMVYNTSSQTEQRSIFPTSQQHATSFYSQNSSSIAPNHKAQIIATTELPVQPSYYFPPQQIMNEIQQKPLHDSSNIKQTTDNSDRKTHKIIYQRLDK
ncbi:13966_t:CDS:1 [Ambispora leptoticha]|uniref:13966_t:CDS:1 n=1 Tax=Ambispora leptoticha TaxID=144679 RepID=A0A9N9AIL6_9GLOM|nr:13966_t:CDS:1 [Ambispora leptoticha]